MTIDEKRCQAAGLKLPVMAQMDAVKAGFRAVTHGIFLPSEEGIARSVESGMHTATAVWVVMGHSVELWRKAREMREVCGGND